MKARIILAPNPLTSIHDTISFDAKDWSLCKKDVWIYGIVCGWDDEALAELAPRFN